MIPCGFREIRENYDFRKPFSKVFLEGSLAFLLGVLAETGAWM